MKNLLTDIRHKILEEMPEYDFTVDENYGQLESETDLYPVAFPCVLLDISDVSWNDMSQGSQEGKCSVVVRLVFDCSDIEANSSIDTNIQYRLASYQKLDRVLHKFSGESYSSLSRSSFRTYPLSGSIKVYESTYNCTVQELIPDYETMSTASLKFSVSLSSGSNVSAFPPVSEDFSE